MGWGLHFFILMISISSKFGHYGDVIMGTMACQITNLTIVYWTVYSGADQRKHQSSVSLAFVRGIHRGPANSTHKWPITRKMFPFDDVIMVMDICDLTGPAFEAYAALRRCTLKMIQVCTQWKHKGLDFGKYQRRIHRVPRETHVLWEWRFFGFFLPIWSGGY